MTVSPYTDVYLCDGYKRGRLVIPVLISLTRACHTTLTGVLRIAQALSAAEHAQKRLHNRTFSGRQVQANFFDEAAFDRHDYM